MGINWTSINVRPETHRKVKILAAQLGVEMGEAVDKLVNKELASLHIVILDDITDPTNPDAERVPVIMREE